MLLKKKQLRVRSQREEYARQDLFLRSVLHVVALSFAANVLPALVVYLRFSLPAPPPSLSLALSLKFSSTCGNEGKFYAGGDFAILHAARNNLHNYARRRTLQSHAFSVARPP